MAHPYMTAVGAAHGPPLYDRRRCTPWPLYDGRRGGRSPGGLEVQCLGDELPMIGRVAESDFRGLGALEIKVHLVLPGEADAAMDLDAVAGGVAVGVGRVGLGDACRERTLGC